MRGDEDFVPLAVIDSKALASPGDVRECRKCENGPAEKAVKRASRSEFKQTAQYDERQQQSLISKQRNSIQLLLLSHIHCMI